MGLFSNLLKKAGSDLIKDVVKSAEKAVSGSVNNAVNNAVNGGRPQGTRPVQSAQSTWQPVEEEPSGFSWGPTMPAEENQFNSGLPYAEYFERIFRTEFADCQLTREARGPRSTVFTFYRGGQTALVVELLSKSSDAKKLRKDCRAAGIPYLRYYYDYEGWWNTRAYVVTLTRAALGG